MDAGESARSGGRLRLVVLAGTVLVVALLGVMTLLGVALMESSAVGMVKSKWSASTSSWSKRDSRSSRMLDSWNFNRLSNMFPYR